MTTFDWIDYSVEFLALVESWLDDEAVKYTGLDEGWEAYYNYYVNELSLSDDEKVYFKIACEGNIPFGIIALGYAEGHYVVSEFLISPKKRSKGYGTSALRDILLHGDQIIGADIASAKAVIYPNNVVSQRAFEKAGFEFESAHPDGDAWYYVYEKR